MPYKSDKQRRFFHTKTAAKQGITPEMVNEYDQASKGMNLPEKASTPSREQEYRMYKRRKARRNG